jgi:muramoyltetrapeptide carboxypeptidase
LPKTTTLDASLDGFLVPPALEPGARVRIIAPASPFDRALFFRGVGWLAERYRVEIAPGTLARRGFLAGTDAERRQALDDALAAPDVRAILAARGGYGSIRISHLANWRHLRKSPKWIIGYSDITALHVEASGMRVCSMHAENACGLGRGDAHARAAWLDALEQPARARRFHGLDTLRRGSAEGVLTGGNLTVLFAAHAAGRLRLPNEAVLVLEDVTESSYRIDRMLSALLLSRVFDRVAAVVLGEFTDCSPGPQRVPVEAVLAERLGALDVPVLAGLPAGHGRNNAPLPFGMKAQVDARAGTLTLLGSDG